MMIKERWRGALFIGLLWAVVIALMYYFIELDPKISWLYFLFAPLLLMALGLVVYLGGAMLLIGYNSMSKEERTKYNENKITSFMGVSLVLLSFIIFPALMYIEFLAVFVAALILVLLYVSISKRFRVDAM